MSEVKSTPTFQKEKTFLSYNHEQGKAYAQVRRDYHPNVYQTVLDYHTSTGGQLDTLVDVGCGPGNATRQLGMHFNHAVGLDPSQGMISMARSLGGSTSTSEAVRFEISDAQELGANISPPIQDSSVDLIIAATAAHWFDMSGFWPRAARVLKPGGSVAIWTTGEPRTDPNLPNAIAIQAAVEEHEERNLRPYFEPGNLLNRNRYRDLLLPWTLPQPVPEFDESAFIRKEWDYGDQFIVGEPEVDLDTFEKVWASASAQTRWYQAHPDDVGTERDPVKMLRRKLEALLHDAGVEKGKEWLRGAVGGTLLVVKKKTA
ncbi:uncharacterized protein A1O9_07065 [Exophiala aquamarina CBS 119918]|uniref:Methyltransferase type 11 domain-containing protein n=1 Tax=Exophiala aquamarina CBS 119918 TaxID=1182545 RepID=A0A072PMY0_9EURO|nr:uncharacterized protein A1O9_07065 [Exophiala aquamarina CBS 119918]KEF56875.1 hypothetical protein A1O9_07065 [Exophiala aquamarina CBS 119918]